MIFEKGIEGDDNQLSKKHFNMDQQYGFYESKNLDLWVSENESERSK